MSEPQTDLFRRQLRQCGMVLTAVICGTIVMLAASYAPLPSSALRIGIVLAAAFANAVIVAGSLMHLVSEKKAILAVLAFTAVFFVGLMGLTIWAAHDVPTVVKLP